MGVGEEHHGGFVEVDGGHTVDVLPAATAKDGMLA